MAIVQCANSHYYDNEKYSSCPHCAALAGRDGEALSDARQLEDYATAYVRQQAKNQTKGQKPMHAPQPEETEEQEEWKEIRHTAGWLVCIEGPQYGKDFPLYAGFNRLGRDAGSDVVLTDPKVSREEHCSVVYEERKNVFYLYPKAGHLVYMGEENVLDAQELKSGQTITLGETTLEFVPYCIGEKRWEKR